MSAPDSFMPVDKNEKIKEISAITPDYNVHVPVSYKKIAIDTLDNGLEVHSYKMSNGYRVTIVPMEGSPAIVKSYVNVGSLNETPNIKGISHFLEHMAFNGTNGENGHIELKQGDSFKKIDKLGGWANASTNYTLTDYVNSTPLLNEKDLETQIQVIASMAEDLKLSDDMIQKEKGPVSSEINMILDNPQTIAMDQTVRTLFNIKNPADELVGGSVSHIKNLTREDVINYYNTYYTPDNTNIVITGDVNPEKTMEIVAKNFTSQKVSKGKKFEEKIVPIESTVRKDFVSDKASSSEIVIGFCGPKNNDTKGKILYELAAMYLNSHEAGLTSKLKKYNVYPIIADEKVSTNPKNPRLGFITLTPSKENTEPVIKAVFNSLGGKTEISEEVTNRLKQRMKQQNEDILEHSSSVNNNIGYSLSDNDLEYFINYNKILDSISPQELSEAVNKYFDVSKAAVTVIHPAGSDNKISQNNENLSFKGGNRKPLDLDEISEYKLKNNYDIGFYNTKSNNINISLKLINDIPYVKKAGVVDVLNELYKMGMKGVSQDKFDNFKDKNNIKVAVRAHANGISCYANGDISNYMMSLSTMKELLYNPNITEENIKKAVSNIKDRMDRAQISSGFIQSQVDRMLNPYEYTRNQIRENLDNITVEDVRELHNYMIKNSRGVVTANIPKQEEYNVKSNILESFNRFKSVEPNNYRQLELYRDIKEPMVITIENTNSQADISETFRFKCKNDIKEYVTAELMNSILSSSSIGLFDVLREKENLAYSVHSNFDITEDLGKITLNILTTTDNKDIGEYSYDNLQKSINGFNRQIDELKNGKFTDEDLEIAKRSMKAALLNNEGNYSKLLSLETGMMSKYDINLKNRIYDQIDSITKNDIENFAKKIFANNPIYSITASKDTLESNKEFLDSLKTTK